MLKMKLLKNKNRLTTVLNPVFDTIKLQKY